MNNETHESHNINNSRNGNGVGSNTAPEFPGACDSKCGLFFSLHEPAILRDIGGDASGNIGEETDRDAIDKHTSLDRKERADAKGWTNALLYLRTRIRTWFREFAKRDNDYNARASLLGRTVRVFFNRNDGCPTIGCVYGHPRIKYREPKHIR